MEVEQQQQESQKPPRLTDHVPESHRHGQDCDSPPEQPLEHEESHSRAGDSDDDSHRSHRSGSSYARPSDQVLRIPVEQLAKDTRETEPHADSVADQLRTHGVRVDPTSSKGKIAWLPNAIIDEPAMRLLLGVEQDNRGGMPDGVTDSVSVGQHEGDCDGRDGDSDALMREKGWCGKPEAKEGPRDRAVLCMSKSPD